MTPDFLKNTASYARAGARAMSTVATTTKPLSLGQQVVGALLEDPEFVPLMKAVIVDGLKAETWIYSKQAKDWVPKVDARARLEAWKLAMAYGEGLPLQRIIQANIGSTGVAGLNDLVEALDQSPALRTSLERALEKSKSKTPAIEVGGRASG